MKLPRYYNPQTKVSELQSVRNAAISPAEAANATLAKYEAIASGAKAISDVAVGIAEMKSEVEVNNAISDTDNALNALDRDIDEMPVEKDENGNVVFDADKILKLESDARKSLIGAVRENIKSGQAKRLYDRYTRNLNIQRNDTMRSVQLQRERKILETNSKYRTEALIKEDRFNDALEQVSKDVEIGIISVPDYNAARVIIKKARDERVITKALMSPDTTDTEIELLTESLEKGEWSDLLGFDDPKMEIDDKDRMQWQARLYAREAQLDDVNNLALKEAQDENTMVLLREIVAGRATPRNIADLELEGFGLSNIKYLIAQARAMETETKSDRAALEWANDLIVKLMVDGASGDDPQQVIRAIKENEDILGDDQITLINKVNQTVNSVSQMQPQRRVLNTELVQLQGLTLEETARESSDDRRSERTAGELMKQAFWQYGLALGADFTEEAAINWINENKTKYYKIALSETMANKGFDISAMPDDREEAYKWIRGRVILSQKEYFAEIEEDFDAIPENEQAIIIADEMRKIQMLLRHVWAEGEQP